MFKNIIIKIQDNFIWFTPIDKISLEETNLPMELLMFSSRMMYWKLQMVGFENTTGILTVVIVDYDSDEIEQWQSQSPKRKIAKLKLQSILWEPFSRCLSYYDGKLQKSISQLLTSKELHTSLNRKPVTILHRLSINKMKIGSGCLTYSKKVNWSKEHQLFTIEHPLMIPQMELIKPYFYNIMGGKMIDVEVSVIHQGNHVDVIKTHAPQLQKINKDSLYIMRGLQVND